MKRNKFITAVMSFATAAALSVSMAAGCQSKCDHAYRWTPEKAATCTERGVERGVCNLCGNVTTRRTDIDADAHGYGEWKITEPTEESAGVAVKDCSHSKDHSLSVVLPSIASSEGYDEYEVVKAPTAVEEGKLHLVINNDVENIEFDVVLPKRTVENVEDAVVLGSSLGGLIRSVTGRTGMGYVDKQRPNGDWLNQSAFSYEFGDNYTHVVDGADKRQSWFSLDDKGDPFGIYVYEKTEFVGDEDNPTAVTTFTDPAVMPGVTLNHLKGYTYAHGGNSIRSYGAEDLLARYYEAATLRSNVVNYSDSLSKLPNGEVDAQFSFSYYENPNFCRYNIEFTLYPNGAIKTLTLTTKIIRGYMIAESDDGEKLFYDDGEIVFGEVYEYGSSGENLYERDEDGNIIYETDANGDPVYFKDINGNIITDKKGNPVKRPLPQAGTQIKGYYSDDHSEVATRTIEFTEQVLKTENDEVPENPYPSDMLYIHSFDARYGGTVIGEDGISIPSNEVAYIDILNILPTSATLDYDPLSVYLRTEGHGDMKLSSDFSATPYKIIGFFNTSDNRVTVRSQQAGEVTLVLKTAGGLYEKVIKVNVRKGAPSSLLAEAYLYTESDGGEGHVWTGYDSANLWTVYVGQKLYIRAAAPQDEKDFADTSFNALSSSNYVTVENGVQLNGETVANVVATQAGEYQVGLRSTVNSGKWVNTRIKVIDPPAVSDLFTGEYNARLQYVRVGSQTVAADLKVTMVPDASDWKTGKIQMDIGGNECVFVYEYNPADNSISAQYESGVSGETYDFTFKINEAYKITVTHSIGYGTRTETVVLNRAVTQP